ncbi:hypothetical protein LCGC14_0321370 [marine sediment metagenome]|uniref:tRNA(Ile)-lysidine synthetase n=1 Tax=marine sediment metagenome TaxID=412755 RepID=A0A0F9TJD1_9ZZZZ
MSQGDPFILNVGETIDREELIAPSARVVVGVSGGLDSVVLLDVLAALAGADGRGYDLMVAHLDHALRDAAAADAAFVAELADSYHLPCTVQRRDVAAVAAETGQSIETAARMVRYEFLGGLARTFGAACVAVAHHADDNVETVLHRLLRGTHLRGLAGMPIRRPMGGGPIDLVRPLLPYRRDEIRAYAQRRHLRWREDETNRDTQYRRNFIRHELLPLLRSRFNPRVDEALMRLAGSAGDVEDHLARLGAETFSHARLPDAPPGGVAMDARSLGQHPQIVITYAMRVALETLGAPLAAVTGEHLRQMAALAIDSESPAVALPGGLAARRCGDRIVIAPADTADAEPVADAVADAVELACPGTTRLPDGSTVTAVIEPLDRREFAAHCRQPVAGAEYLDADAVTGPLLCRPRCDGDVFHPLGAPGRQSVGDFLTNAKVPRENRRRVRCICDAAGVVYVAPLRIDDRVKITDASQRAIRLTCRKGDDGP